MSVYNVTFTLEVLKKLDDGTQVKVQRLLGAQPNIVAKSVNAAVAMASRKLPVEIDEETLSVADVHAQQLVA